MPLDIKAELNRLREAYEQDARQNSFNLLLLGLYGSGKTYLLTTARTPIHIDSFDPGGTKNLRPMIDKGLIVVDTEYESEDPLSPVAYKAWYPKFNERLKSGYFNHFATYCLDSSTTWNMSILGAYLKSTGDAKAVPTFKEHYHPQMLDIKTYVYRMLNLPCDTILTGHIELIKDERDGSVEYQYATTGKGSFIIPSLFDEIWVMNNKETSKGVDYRILTQNIGKFKARTRIGSPNQGKFETYEKPDIKYLLNKAGRSTADLPHL